MIYVFGYGSLININTINELSNIPNKKTCPVNIDGLKRSWHVRGKIQTYLGIEDNPNYTCNGLLIEVTELELDKLSKREEFYIKRPIDKSRIRFDYDKFLQISDDIIYSFYSLKYDNPDRGHPILQKYIYRCLIGCIKISKKFYNDFLIGVGLYRNNPNSLYKLKYIL